MLPSNFLFAQEVKLQLERRQTVREHKGAEARFRGWLHVCFRKTLTALQHCRVFITSNLFRAPKTRAGLPPPVWRPRRNGGPCGTVAALHFRPCKSLCTGTGVCMCVCAFVCAGERFLFLLWQQTSLCSLKSSYLAVRLNVGSQSDWRYLLLSVKND